jgi:uncharacterized protein YkwD
MSHGTTLLRMRFVSVTTAVTFALGAVGATSETASAAAYAAQGEFTRTSTSSMLPAKKKRPKVRSSRTPTKPVAPTGQQPTELWQQDMLARVNTERARAGVAPLAACLTLEVAAQAHSADQARTGTLSHNGSDGSSMSDRVARAGYLNGARSWSLAENVAWNYPNTAAVVAGWMASPGHRTNLLSATLTHVGFGVSDLGGGPYWTQNFGSGGTC